MSISATVLSWNLGDTHLHDGVATGAGDGARLVDAAPPIGSIALFVAGKADAVVFLDGAGKVFRPERNDTAYTPSATGLDMRRTRAVAIFTGKLSRLGFSDSPHQGF